AALVPENLRGCCRALACSRRVRDGGGIRLVFASGSVIARDRAPDIGVWPGSTRVGGGTPRQRSAAGRIRPVLFHAQSTLSGNADHSARPGSGGAEHGAGG